MGTVRRSVAVPFLAAALALACTGAAATPRSATPLPGHTVWLDQAWSEADRRWFYQVSQGSAVLSWDIYANIETANGRDLFRSDANAIRFGLIPQRPDPKSNPDGLPIGVAKATIREGRWRGDWVGLTCAACHTSVLHYRDTNVIIDGGGAHTFSSTLMTNELDAALQAHLADAGKFDRLAARIGVDGERRADLRRRLESQAAVIHHYTTVSVLTSVVWGPGRSDALTGIHNQLQANLTGIPENWYPATAPAKPPFLWNAPQSDWVQWSGVVQDPIFRNVGETTGVYAAFDLRSASPEDGLFDASTDILHLWQIETALQRLAPPKWPERLFGRIDRAKAAQGARLFEENCAGCHTSWPYKWTEPNRHGKRYIDNRIVKASYVGTDAHQLDDRLPYARTGALARWMPAPFTDNALVPEAVFTVGLVTQLIDKATARLGLTQEELDDLHGYQPYGREAQRPPPELRGYKAGPRDGVWATAPFLHNGSVPNLYEMLLPAAQRSKTFRVGRGFDPHKVGIDTTEADAFLFDTTLPGNSNAGHSFEDGPKGNGVIGRLLTDEERWAIVEYLKSIPDVDGRITPYGGPGSTPHAGGRGDWRTQGKY